MERCVFNLSLTNKWVTGQEKVVFDNIIIFCLNQRAGVRSLGLGFKLN